MTVLSEIKRMQAEGKTEEEIINSMKQRGISPREITEALSQSKIQEAVTGEAQAPGTDTIPMMGESQMPAQPAQQSQPMPAQYAPSAQYPSAQMPAQPIQAAQAYPEYPQQQYEYAQPSGISPDTITEISEQVVSEKLSPLRKELEKITDMRTTLESKTESLDERLKRIEKIIDKLQLSINQRVGEFLTNVDDIKKEITETQKSFKALSSKPAQSRSREEKSRKE